MHRKNRPPLDDPAIIPLEPVASGETSVEKRIICKMCFAKRAERDSPCPNCGFDERAGLQASTIVGKQRIGKSGLRCTSCGYILQGLSSPRCPECGTVAVPQSKRERYAEVSRDVTREAYRTPLLMILIGGGVLIGLLFFLHGPAAAGVALMSYAIQVVIGVAVFLACCALWIGFDAPIHLTALRLMGIYMVVDLIGVGTSFIPLVGWVIPLFFYVGLLSEMLEMEMNDAIVVGLLTYFAKVIAAIAIVAAIV